MLLKSVVLVEVALLVLLGSLEMILGFLDKLLNVLYKVNSSKPPKSDAQQLHQQVI